MSVYCVNSANTYDTLALAEVGEAGQHVGLVVFLVSGFDTSTVTFSGSDYDDVEIKADNGFVWDGVTSNLTAGVGEITSSADSIMFRNIAVKSLNLAYSELTSSRNCYIGYLNGGGITVSIDNTNSTDFRDTVFEGTGRTSSAANPNFKYQRCTVISASGYGVIRGHITDCALLNTGSATLISSASVANTYTDDGANGSTLGLAESDFVDYAAGDYRLKSDSTAGAAGAGAFIQQVQASDFDINAAFLTPAPVVSANLSNDAPGFDVGASFAAPSVEISSSLSVANPEFNLSSGFIATSPVLSASLSSDTPEINLSASFSAPMPVFSASLAGDVPEFNLSASFVVPHVTSAVHLSAELPEFDVSVSVATPSVELSSLITTSVDDVDLSASFTVPSVVLGAVLINGDIIKITPTENIIDSKPKSRMLFTKDRGRYL